MRIGIITLYAGHNYGAFLQAYALQRYLENNTNAHVELIAFMYEAQAHNHILSYTSKKGQKNYKYYYDRCKMFDDAPIKYDHLSDFKIVSDNTTEFCQKVNERYDIVITGSDEIWRLDRTEGFPNVYWLPDVKNCIKMSYAVSSRMELHKIEQQQLDSIHNLLEDFSYIGVRDGVTKELIDKALGRNDRTFLNCDPTFLYDFHAKPSNGNRIIEEKFGVSNRNKKTIAMMVNNRSLAQEIIQKYGNDFNFICLYEYYEGTAKPIVLDPFEWMDVIAACDGLITTFFHGMVFAIKNNTPFFIVETRKISEKKYSKSYDLLNRNDKTKNFALLQENEKEIALRQIGTFLADVLTQKAEADFSKICFDEKKRAESFLRALPQEIFRKSVAIKESRDCCSCGLCAAICPQKAIQMQPDSEGFIRPIVDEKKCNNCGLCLIKCTFKNGWANLRTWDNTPSSFALCHKDESVRMASRSGGAFTALSDEVLRQGGIVYGVVLDDDMEVKHIRAESLAERDRMRGSKYVQSRIDTLYLQIKQDLHSGRTVLFSGTPCQVAAIRKFLEKEDTTNLFLVDLVCHGVSSPRVWKDYWQYCEKAYGGKIEKFDFRNKQKYGWSEHIETFQIHGEEHDSRDFSKLFNQNNNNNLACHYCQYKTIERVSDISLADFWKVKTVAPEMFDDKGISLVLVNSPKGKLLFEKSTKDVAVVKPIPIELCVLRSMRESFPEPYGRVAFWNEYEEQGLAGLLVKRKKEEIEKKSKENRQERIRKTLAYRGLRKIYRVARFRLRKCIK